MRMTLFALALLPLAAPTQTAAQTTSPTTDHTAHATAGAESPAAAAFLAANARMHEAMTVEMTGDADVDFLRGMIPHHQGAVEMAKIVLEHGRDPEVRKLAEAIIAAQEKEIAWMTGWLAQHGQ